MSTDKSKITAAAGAEDSAAEAAAEEEAAKKEADVGTYTHTFRKPFTHQGHTVESLTFNWDTLTGADHCAIENEILMRGKTLVTPEFSSEFLCGMAVRACSARDDNGIRILNADAMKAMPMRDFQVICKKARSFLLRAGS